MLKDYMSKNYYIYYICAAFPQKAKLPPEFKPYIKNYGLLFWIENTLGKISQSPADLAAGDLEREDLACSCI